ncbi:MAG: BRO family protein [Candidatus Gracilibacteria bacterium]|nr:BRO family protein [Candidatus Gracilibacteria bacterium]MDQ7023565.1 BRO family protein [Candidatus Gracilibacteria bacterium]
MNIWKGNKSITLFDYKNIKLRTVLIDGDIWFVAKDIYDIFELTNLTEATKKLSDKR